MRHRIRVAAPILVSLGILLGNALPAKSQNSAPDSAAASKEAVVSTRASGTFEVKLNPLATAAGDSTLGRMSIDKIFHGDLQGTSRGEMLTAMSAVRGSAGYVAVERVSGTLHGKTGTFVLQHNGTMNRGEPLLTVSVVPDSGTEELTGLSGTMKIIIAEGKHSYEFDFTIAPTP